MAAQTIHHCALCAQEVVLYPQMSRLYGECRNLNCRAFGITLTLENLQTLTLEKAKTFPDLARLAREAPTTWHDAIPEQRDGTLD